MKSDKQLKLHKEPSKRTFFPFLSTKLPHINPQRVWFPARLLRSEQIYLILVSKNKLNFTHRLLLEH